MSEWKAEEFAEALLGNDNDLDNELASEILQAYKIDEDGLVSSFKILLREKLGNLPEESKEANNLRRTLNSVIKSEKESSPHFAKPRDHIKNLFDGLSSAFQKPAYSFHKRTNGEMPDQDVKLLDDLSRELEDEDET